MHLSGRATELAHLEQAWRSAATRSGAIVVGGDAGIGKSALVAAFTERAGVTVLRGECRECGGDALPYAPFADALGDPALADPGRPRTALFAEVRQRLEAAAPVVLVLEDVHWSDRPSRDLLEFLGPALRRPGVLIVATRRGAAGLAPGPLDTTLGPLDFAHGPQDFAPRPQGSTPGPQDFTLGAIGPRPARSRDSSTAVAGPRGRDRAAAQDFALGAQDFTLGPLDEAAAGDLLTRRLGHRAGSAVIAGVWQYTRGNPLLLELAADLPDPQSPPDDLLLAPFRSLPAPTRAAVRVAAVLGPEVDGALLGRVAGNVGERLRPAVERGLLVAGEGGYRFRHALIRAAVYADLRPAERTRLHELAAAAITARLGFRPGTAALVALAEHWHAAGDTDRAFDAAWRAAGAVGAASGGRLRLLERVAATWNRVFDPGFRTGTDRVAVLAAAASAALHAGALDRGIALAGEALDGTRDPARQAVLLETRSRLRYRGGDDGLTDLRDALALAPRNNRVRATLAARLEFLTRSLEARVLAEEAAADRDPAVRAVALVTLASAACDPQPGADPGDSGAAVARRRAREAADLARESGDDDTYVLARTMEAAALEAAGDSRAAVAAAEAALVAARRTGLPPSRTALPAAAQAGSLSALGEWDRARTVIADALRCNLPPVYRAVLLTGRAWLDAVTGDRSAATADADEAAALLGSQYTGRQFWTPLWEVRALLGTPPPLGDGQLPMLPALAWSLLLSSRSADSGAGSSGSGSSGSGSSGRGLARRLPVNGPVQRAASLTVHGRWDEAIAAWRAVGHPFRLAQTLLLAAHAARDRSTAAVRAREALTLATRLGAGPLTAAADELLRSERLEPGPARLTGRETEVLRLLADGRTNKQIAEALAISPKTAGVHVTNILAKLGSNSRGEATAVAHRRGLLA
ncbi:AAA family ATPase [Dactylosporangium sp. NPDC051541]|uniref:AAA family ATPase n=1 Tax=Dactylosporangium sp. NPDC051541 TaxID=3363977 RepID=UPI003799D484